jgi:hypothetical protein
MRGDIVEEAVSGGKLVLSRVGLIGGVGRQQ